MAASDGAVNGVLKVETDEDKLAVTLRFEKSEDGDEWTAERLGTVLKERGIQGEIKVQALKDFLAQAAKTTQGPHEAVVLRGVEPVIPAAETVEWKELTVPDELTDTVGLVLSHAESPKIFRERTEQIKKSKQVEKKGRVPFLRAKIKTVTDYETKVHRERIPIDPHVEESFYVEEGAELGTVKAQQQGIPGRTVYGKAIPIKPIVDPLFYAGENLSRTGESLVAATTGILRIGRNWADIVPFTPHRWELELSPDNATCYLNLTPGHPDAKAPEAAAIRAAAVEIPYPEESLIDEEELARLIRDQIELGTPERLPVTLSRDASFDIFVTDDKLHATLNVHKGKGRGKPLSLREVGAAIKQSGLKQLDFKKIQTEITEFFESSEFDLTGYILAEGESPAEGQERKAEFTLRFYPDEKTNTLRERLAAAKEKPDSLEEFPPEKILKTAPVEAEQLICTLDPFVPGENGRDVYGQEIPGKPGPTPEFRLFENIEQKELVISTTAAGILDYGEEDGVYYLRVRSVEDATVSIEVDEDRMAARLTLREGSGSGIRLSRELLDKEIESSGVVHGIIEEVLAKALLAAQAETDVEGIVFARATQPIHQSENQIEFIVNMETNTPVRIRQDGSADFRTQNKIVTVTKGQDICRILPSEHEAVDGTNVLGNPIAAGHTSGAALEFGEGIETFDQEDGSTLVRATIDGELVQNKSLLEIRNTYSVEGDVDMAVGNVKFPGTILIKGTVRTGFYVVSTGDIKVGGGVEGALLSADGDILIKEGVKGAGKAVLRSKNKLMSPFVELATILSVGDVVLKSAAVRSRIKCNGKISFQGNNGRIVGGIVRARNGMTVQSIGSPRGIKTHISFGQDYLIADLIEKEEKEVEKIKWRVSQIDIEMTRSAKSTDNAILTGLQQEKVKLLKLLEKRGLRLFTLRERFEQHFTAVIEVAGEVHGGTVFESHGRTHEITNTRKGVRVDFDPQTGNLNVSDLKGE